MSLFRGTIAECISLVNEIRGFIYYFTSGVPLLFRKLTLSHLEIQCRAIVLRSHFPQGQSGLDSRRSTANVTIKGPTIPQDDGSYLSTVPKLLLPQAE